MFCMNCVSAGECGGSVARVDEGNVRVGWPGAPGWTTTGVSWAAIGRDNRHTNAMAGKYSITNGHSLHSLTEACGVFFGRSIYTASSGYSARRHASICVGSTTNYRTFPQNTGRATWDLIGPAIVLRRRRLDRTRLACSFLVLRSRVREL